MKESLLIIILSIFSLTLHAQKDTRNINPVRRSDFSRNTNINISIYPVPVRENRFTIKSDRDVSSIKITNIIGQNIYRVNYSNPQQLNKISLNNPKRGMYLVTIIFSDGSRTVKKIMVEESD
jgi:Secretion system C-terminal sorting domain